MLTAIKSFQLKEGDKNTVEVTYLSGKKAEMTRTDFLNLKEDSPKQLKENRPTDAKKGPPPIPMDALFELHKKLLIAVLNRQEPVYTLFKKLSNAEDLTYDENGLKMISNDGSETNQSFDFDEFYEFITSGKDTSTKKVMLTILGNMGVKSSRDSELLDLVPVLDTENDKEFFSLEKSNIERVVDGNVSVDVNVNMRFTKENDLYSIYLIGGSYSGKEPFRTGIPKDEFISLCENTFETGEKAINDEKEKSVTDLLKEYELPDHTKDGADKNNRIINQVLPLMMHLDTTRIAGHKYGKR